MLARDKPPLHQDFPKAEVFFAYSRFVRVLLMLWLVAGFAGVSYAQKSKQQLEREKKQNLKKITETNQILQETSEQRQASVGQLSALNQQISTRNQLINSISGRSPTAGWGDDGIGTVECRHGKRHEQPEEGVRSHDLRCLQSHDQL